MNIYKNNEFSELAILGGSPVRSDPLPTYNMIGSEEKKAVMDVLDSGELSGFIASDGKEFWGGKSVLALEEAFKKKFSVGYAVAVNSATSGLHCALYAAGISPGDEVIVPPYTMSASATTVLFSGGVPIFCDIDPDSFCIDPAKVEDLINSRTKAIVAVNLFGQPAALKKLRAISDKFNLILIEDNSQAPAAQHHGAYAATIGHMGVFSFNRHKTMQCGEGGVVVTNDGDFALRMAMLRNHGECIADSQDFENFSNTVGLNYRMTEMEAAVALVQLQKLDSLNAKRIKLADEISSNLTSLPGFQPPYIEPGNTHVYYFYAIKFNAEEVGLSREIFCKAVEAEGFNARAGYLKPLYLEPHYQKKICFGTNGFPFTANSRIDEIIYSKGICPVVERLADSELIITNIIYPPLTKNDMQKFVEACEKVVKNKDALNKAFSKGH